MNLVDELGALFEHFAGAEHRAIVLHHLLHPRPQLRGRRAARGMAELVEARQRPLGRILGQFGMLVVGGEDFGAAMRRGAPKHHEVDQRIRPEPVGAMHRDASGFAERHQARYHRVRVAVLLGQHLAVEVRRDAAHVVMHGRQHRDRLLGDVDVGKNARCLRNAGQALVQHLRVEVVEGEENVILLRPDAAALADFDGHGAGDHVTRGEIFGRGRIALHEALAF